MFWQDGAQVDAMARLYLRLVELARLPPLDGLRELDLHTQVGSEQGFAVHPA
jgi:hypothetical protein